MKILLGLVGVTLAAGLYWFLPDRLSELEAAEVSADATFQVRRSDLVITVAENGYLKAKKSMHLKPRFRGSGTITHLIEEGSQVEEGELLAEFDKTELQNDLDESRNSLIQYETELEAAVAELEVQKRDNTSELEKAELALDVAKLTLERYVKGEFPNEMRKKKLAVEKASSELARAREKYEQAPRLMEEGFLTSLEVEEERIKVREAEINEENAVEDLSLYETYTYPMELRQKEAAVKEAERTLLSTSEKAQIRLKEKDAQVARGERKVQSAQGRINLLEEDIEKRVIRAPQPGLVYYGEPGNSWTYDQVAVGNTVWQGVTIITLPDLSDMQAVIDVHEADVNQLEVGQPVTIKLDTYKGRVFKGSVSKIATVANSDRRDSNNRHFEIEIDMDKTENTLRGGITAKVEIEIERLENVVQVPVHAVFTEQDSFFCFVATDSGFERREVEIGRNNEHYVAILSGLSEDELVLLYDPRREGLQDSGGDAETEEADNGMPQEALAAN